MRTTRFIMLLALLLSVLANVSSVWAQDAPAAGGPAFVPGEVLIQFRPGTTAAQHQNARARAAAVRSETVRAARAGKGDLELAALRGVADVSAAIAVLEADPNVLFAEPNWIYTHQSTSTDPYYTNGSLWGMYGDATSPSNQYGSQAGEAWATGSTGSKDVYIGIIDEGIQYTHPDLDANVWTNPYENASDGIDNDGNGKVDDVHGWDFANGDKTIYDGTGDDHGTHVAGTIAAEANSAGVVGVNWNVTYISGKFLSSKGGTTASAIAALDYMTDLKTRHGLNIVATNNSWGGGGFSQALLDAITRGAKQNILFIAAAGNGDRFGRGLNNDSTANYPSNYNTTAGAGYDSVIAVAAIDKIGARAGFSNYGATTVDLGAPGVGIYSTVPSNSYASYNGTSMATPHVTGAAALYAAAHPDASAADIRAAILTNTTATTSLAGRCVTGGRLNVGSLLSATPTPTETATPTPNTISGKVTSASGGAAIGGATVSIANTSLTAQTDPTGNYSIADVPEGTYSVTAAADGYISKTTDNVSVSAGIGATVNIALDVVLPPPLPAGAMYVSSITWQKQGSSLLTTVTVRWDSDRDGIAEPADEVVPNATVSLNLNGPGGPWTANSTTNSSGYVTFKLSKAASGTYTAEVTNLQHSSYGYDPSSNLDGSNNPSTYTM